MSNSGTSYIEKFDIEQRKLSRNSNGHNFSLGCPIREHNISRRTKLNNGGSRVIQMVISFHSPSLIVIVIYISNITNGSACRSQSAYCKNLCSSSASKFPGFFLQQFNLVQFLHTFSSDFKAFHSNSCFFFLIGTS